MGMAAKQKKTGINLWDDPVVFASQAVTIASKQHNLDSSSLRPCIAITLYIRFGGDNAPLGRNDAGHIIAVECARLGCNLDRIMSVLEKWNDNNIRPLGLNELKGIAESALRKLYDYSCRHPRLEAVCPFSDKKDCLRFDSKKRTRRSEDNSYFIYHWPELLNPSERCLYNAIRDIELKRGVRIGAVIYASYRHLRQYSGVALHRIKPGLMRLQEKGLITFKVGVKHRRYHKATEIQRTIPVPAPSPELAARFEEDEE